MRGSSALRTSVAPGGALAGPWARNPLWTRARAVPSLDLCFADIKSLSCAATGQNLVTFTRASSGTYVDSQGVIRTATTNLLLRSEEFDNAYWTKNNSCTITQNDTTAPNGTLTADRFNGAALSSTGVYVFPATISGLVYTFSVYVKNLSGATSLRLGIESNPVNAFVTFNTATGVISSQGANVTSLSVQATGDGWYRVAVTYTATGSSAGVVIYSTSGLVATWYVWGAQLEQSSTVSEYIPTTSTINSAPRFDHNPTTGESLGLLVEEQRTNLGLYSDVSQSSYIENITVSANNAISPDGTNNATRLTSTTTGTSNSNISDRNVAVSSNTVYTFSCYLKQGNTPLSSINLWYGGGTYREVRIAYTWSSKTIALTGTAGTGFTGSATEVGNGWVRLVVSLDSGNNTSTYARIHVRDNTTSGVTGDFVYAWGRQIEAGSFPTSYIPTTTAAATRSADVASITGAAFSSWYRQDEGTVFADVNSAPVNNVAQLAYDISEGVGNERMFQRRNASGIVATAVLDNGVTQGDIGSVVIGASARYRSGFAYKLNDIELVVNGGGSVTDTSATLPTLDRIHIGQNYASGQSCNGTIRRLVFFPQRLPNSTLQQITS